MVSRGGSQGIVTVALSQDYLITDFGGRRVLGQLSMTPWSVHEATKILPHMGEPWENTQQQTWGDGKGLEKLGNLFQCWRNPAGLLGFPSPQESWKALWEHRNLQKIKLLWCLGPICLIRNRLPREVVTAPSLPKIRKCLDNVFRQRVGSLGDPLQDGSWILMVLVGLFQLCVFCDLKKVVGLFFFPIKFRK